MIPVFFTGYNFLEVVSSPRGENNFFQKLRVMCDMLMNNHILFSFLSKLFKTLKCKNLFLMSRLNYYVENFNFLLCVNMK